MWRKNELLPSVIGLGLVFGLGLGMEGLLGATGREWYPVVRVQLRDGVDWSYRGEYRGDSRFESLLAGLPAMRRQALVAARERTGLDLDDPEGFAVRFRDTSDYGASSRPVRAAGGDLFLVSLSAEQAMLGVMDIRASLVHEFIHCLMRRRMGERDYRALPAWIREGIAVWGAGQLRERSRNLVAGAFLEQRDPDSLREHADRYLIDALTFEWIAQVHGEAAVRELVADLVVGTDPRRAFERATGFDWKEIRKWRRRFTRSYLEDVVEGSGLREFENARLAHANGDRPAAVAWLWALVQERPDSLLLPNAWYWIGRYSEEAGQYELAAGAFATVLDRFPHHLGLQEDSRLRLARTRERAQCVGQGQVFFSGFFSSGSFASRLSR